MGRCIYALDENNPIPEELLPLIIDLPNNLMTVDMQKEINNYTSTDDLEMLQDIIEWIKFHNDHLPDIESKGREEQRKAITLKRIQQKYFKLYTKSKTYVSTKNSVQSTMIWGSQYDAMMLWMEENGVNVNEGIGDLRNNERICGKDEDDEIKNIYDLYGRLRRGMLAIVVLVEVDISILVIHQAIANGKAIHSGPMLLGVPA